MRRLEFLFGQVGGRLFAFAILGALATMLFSSQLSFSVQVAEAQTRGPRRIRSRGSPQKRSSLIAPNFKHESHSVSRRNLDCSHCHTIPLRAAWDEIVAATKSSIKGYPYHDSCLPCHRGTSQPFFKGAAPAVCTVCHTRASPHLLAGEVRPFAKPTRRLIVSELPGFLSHGKHEDLKLPDGDTLKCEYCHRPMKTKDNRMSGVLAAVGNDPLIADGAFKDSPSGHARCFECHWDKDKPMKDNCSGCHLAPDAFGAKTSISLTGDLMVWFKDSAAWPKRLSLKFNHESENHLNPKDPRLMCTGCHSRIKESVTLYIPNVEINSCGGSSCHFNAGRTDIVKEMYRREGDSNQECTGCHIKPISVLQPPCTHLVLFADQLDDYPNVAKQIAEKKCKK